MRQLLAVIFILSWQLLDAQVQYNTRLLPDSLRRGAKAVMRESVFHYIVSSPKKMVLKERFVITVLNAEGREYAINFAFYDKDSRVSKFSGELLDSTGKKIKSLAGQDIIDVSAISGGTMYSDDRVKAARIMHGVYPYTTVFESETVYDGYMDLQDWLPTFSSEMSIEKATLIVEQGTGVNIHHREQNGVSKPIPSTNGDHQVLTWTVGGWAAHKPESHSPDRRGLLPGVLLAPSNFFYEGSVGSYDSWQSYGKWAYELGVGRDELPPDMQAKAKALTASATSVADKAAILYKYMQQNTRYVSVQLGIGGFQPFPANYVVEKGYGDCKALSNYMKAMLKAVGIDALGVIVNAGPHALELFPDFPNNQFNHYILCIPNVRDTLWMECTSSSNPFNFLGSFTENRQVVLLTPKGGVLARTPRYGPDVSVKQRWAEVVLETSGQVKLRGHERYTGNMADRLRLEYGNEPPTKREEMFRESLQLPSFTLQKLDYSSLENKEEVVKVNYELSFTDYTTKAGSRLLLKPHVLGGKPFIPAELKQRKNPVAFAFPGTWLDSVSYQLPPSVRIDKLPNAVTIESVVGSYTASLHYDAQKNSLLYVRRVVYRQNRLPAEQYEAFRKFFVEIAKADGMQVVLMPT